MQPPFPSLTTVWHNESYADISPTRPELSAAGKTVIITGASGGVGRATAISFDRAGASKIVLLGRDEAKLQETQEALSCSSTVHSVAVTDEQGLRDVAAAVGAWDVLILAAGYLSAKNTLKDADTDEWWRSFETNVKGTMVTSKVFLPTANPNRAAIVGLTSGPLVFPPSAVIGASSYFASKLALIKVIEFLAAENPNVFATALHPGMVDTPVLRKFGTDPKDLPVDKAELPGDFMVWLTSPEGLFLNGRHVWANWDVPQLKEKADNIKSGLLLTSGVYGWPYGMS
ncbi:hypothetical protein ASPCAL13763 [Aspergillus calidoustus]|uniref:NADP(+)-dependent dehydrogenase n=1 Tax=Aspergillus calidoustus TaxID=454130 RepID=A0A0U5GGX9_ASPCI|nr:hypothetical protein ASPCAL13763 [Aspergillus calidoustus]